MKGSNTTVITNIDSQLNLNQSSPWTNDTSSVFLRPEFPNDVTPKSNNTGSLGLPDLLWGNIWAQQINVSKLGGLSPIRVSADIISADTIIANQFIGHGGNLTGIEFNDTTGTAILPNVTIEGDLEVAGNISAGANLSGLINCDQITGAFSDLCIIADSVLSPAEIKDQINASSFNSGSNLSITYDFGGHTWTFISAPKDINFNDLLGIPANVFRWEVSGPYLYNDSTTLFFNESVLNDTINRFVDPLINESGEPRFAWQTGTDVLYNNTGTTRVGINTSTPTQTLNVVGDANITGNLSVGTGTIVISEDGILFPDFSFQPTAAFPFSNGSDIWVKNILVNQSITVNGVEVCLANGTNCQNFTGVISGNLSALSFNVSQNTGRIDTINNTVNGLSVNVSDNLNSIQQLLLNDSENATNATFASTAQQSDNSTFSAGVNWEDITNKPLSFFDDSGLVQNDTTLLGNVSQLRDSLNELLINQTGNATNASFSWISFLSNNATFAGGVNWEDITNKPVDFFDDSGLVQNDTTLFGNVSDLRNSVNELLLNDSQNATNASFSFIALNSSYAGGVNWEDIVNIPPSVPFDDSALVENDSLFFINVSANLNSIQQLLLNQSENATNASFSWQSSFASNSSYAAGVNWEDIVNIPPQVPFDDSGLVQNDSLFFTNVSANLNSIQQLLLNYSENATNASFASVSLLSNNATFSGGVNWEDITNKPVDFFDDSGLVQNDTTLFGNVSSIRGDFLSLLANQSENATNASFADFSGNASYASSVNCHDILNHQADPCVDNDTVYDDSGLVQNDTLLFQLTGNNSGRIDFLNATAFSENSTNSSFSWLSNNASFAGGVNWNDITNIPPQVPFDDSGLVQNDTILFINVSDNRESILQLLLNHTENATNASFAWLAANASFAGEVNWFDITNIPNNLSNFTDTNTQKGTQGPYLYNDSITIFFNDTLLNSTIKDIVNSEGDWTTNDTRIYNWTNGTRLGLGTINPSGLFEIATTPVNQTFNETSTGPNVVLFYRFEEGNNGTTVSDSTSYANDGAITGTVTHQASKGGNGTGNYSILFGGTNDYITTPDFAGYNQTNDYTISFWYNNDGNNEIVFYKNFLSDASFYYAAENQAGKMCFYTETSSGVVKRRTTTSQDANVWQHYTIIKTGDTANIFVNGVNTSLQDCAINGEAGTTDLLLGVKPDLSDDSTSFLDEFIIQNQTINSSEALNIYDNGLQLINGTDQFNITSGGSKFSVSEEGHIFVTGISNRSVFDGDVQIKGNLIGGSPVKVVGGFRVVDGSVEINDGGLTVVDGETKFYNHVLVQEGNIDVVDNITAMNSLIGQEFIDLTPAYDKNKTEALKEVKEIKKILKEDGTLELNHSSLPDFVRKDITYFGEEIEGRSLGAMVTVLVEAVQALEEENALLKAEMCADDKKWSWCPDK